MPTYYLIYSRFVDTTVIKSAVILTSLRPGIVSTSWCRHGDFVLELARMHRVERCGHGTNLERRTPYEKQMDMATYYQKVLLAWMLWEKVFPRRRRSRGRQEMDMIGWLELSWCNGYNWLVGAVVMQEMDMIGWLELSWSWQSYRTWWYGVWTM